MRLAAFAFATLALGAMEARPSLAQGVTAFDGTWSGTGTLTRRQGAGTACGPDTTDRRFIIRNGMIEFPYDNRYGVTFSGPIAADGSFSISSGGNSFVGRATGSTMTAQYSGRQCVRDFQMRRRAN
jgi:hypothetical protein